MKYRTIVADPPWRYENARGSQTRSKRGRESIAASGHYPLLDNADIASLPVEAMAEDDCALFLWVTTPRLFGTSAERANRVAPLDIAHRWGFRFITLLTWVKTGPPGLGFHFRGHTEHVIYAVRGDMTIPPNCRESNVIVAPRRRHSQKPDAFYDLVERVSPGPYLELFARQQRLGWDTFGHECFNHISLEVPA